jgi:hypothetical protein
MASRNLKKSALILIGLLLLGAGLLEVLGLQLIRYASLDQCDSPEMVYATPSQGGPQVPLANTWRELRAFDLGAINLVRKADSLRLIFCSRPPLSRITRVSSNHQTAPEPAKAAFLFCLFSSRKTRAP